MSSANHVIKVLHVLHAFSHGGLENGIVNIINNSPPDIEHELCLLTTAGEFIHRLRKPARCYELHKQPGKSLRTILELRRVVRQSRANIVHTRNWGAFDGVLAACLCPGVVLLHGEHGRDITDPRGLNRRRNLMRRSLGFRVQRFTTVSEDLRKWLSQIVRIPDGKIVLIRNGVDTSRFSPRRDPDLRRELGIAEDQFVIGAIGRLNPVKNHASLIRAYTRLASGDPTARLVIVGDGPERGNLELMTRETIGIRAPLLTGYRSDVERFYGVFDVFVLNSLAEGMSNTLLEAMASGLPVVCTPVGANVELVRHGERGLQVALGDDSALASALGVYSSSPAERALHATNARRYVEQKHSLASMVQGYFGLYRELGSGVSR